jgi:hypothetical protein
VLVALTAVGGAVPAGHDSVHVRVIAVTPRFSEQVSVCVVVVDRHCRRHRAPSGARNAPATAFTSVCASNRPNCGQASACQRDHARWTVLRPDEQWLVMALCASRPEPTHCSSCSEGDCVAKPIEAPA